MPIEVLQIGVDAVNNLPQPATDIDFHANALTWPAAAYFIFRRLHKDEKDRWETVDRVVSDYILSRGEE